ncbi:hypothetical protein CEXT_648541 [Caerostris extrusa]|uniref:Uncharacterized protein n=1 Tax=Caerostris extrusa TaxID=172846 RepID=A0AAV4V4S3_CAEEX|nr:hypothetical protein CEXT_648541 [Caerostris extrusa]
MPAMDTDSRCVGLKEVSTPIYCLLRYSFLTVEVPGTDVDHRCQFSIVKAAEKFRGFIDPSVKMGDECSSGSNCLLAVRAVEFMPTIMQKRNKCDYR